MTSTNRRQGVARGLLALAFLVGVAMVGLWSLQRQLVYFPDRTQVPPATEVIPGARDVTLLTDDGLELGAWFVTASPARDAGMAVLLAPGNGGNRAGRAGLAEELRRRGLSVLVMDYRGYGGNPGSPSETGLLADAAAGVRALEELGYPPECTIYLGESIGAGVVAALQVSHPPAGMVLRSPFTDLAAVGAHHYPFLPVRLLLRDRFPVLEHVQRSGVPVTVVYGDRDRIVPTGLSAQVANAAPSLVEEVVLEEADHNDAMMFGPEVADAVARLAEHVRR